MGKPSSFDSKRDKIGPVALYFIIKSWNRVEKRSLFNRFFRNKFDFILKMAIIKDDIPIGFDWWVAGRREPAFAFFIMHKPRKTIVYIDGFNLYYRLKNTHCKWLDLKSLCDLCLDSAKHKIIKIKYFTALVKENIKDPSNTIRQQLFLRALRTIPNLEIIFGQFKERQVKGFLCDENKKTIAGKIVTIKKWEEKETDVNIAVHLMEDAYAHKDMYECSILFSNDTDLKMPLSRVKKQRNLLVL